MHPTYHSILLILLSLYLSLTPTLISGSYFDISSCSTFFPCIHVATTGDDTQIGSLSSPVRTVQRALDLVVPQSPALPTRIVLQDGEYPGGIVWKGSAVTLISVGGSDSTLITCSQPNERGIWIGSGESATTVISGVTIQNCSINMGAGMAIVGVNTKPTLRNVVFRNNQAINGAGLLAFLSSPVLICTEFYDGSARDGAGLYVVHNATVIPLLQFQQMSLAVNYQHPAGAPIPDGANAVIISTDMRATGNKAVGIGGGIYSNAATLVLSRAIFQSNQGGGSGGIGLAARSRLTVSDSSFIGNRALQQMSGAIAVRQGSSATITRVTFIENEAAESGGAIAVGEPGSILNVDASTFIANKATRGSIIAFDPTPRIGSTITNSRATGNIASENGGIFFANVPTARNVNLSSNTFENNVAVFGADYGSVACSIGFITSDQYGDSTHTPTILPTGFVTQLSQTVNNLATMAFRVLIVDAFGQRITAPGVVNEAFADVIPITPAATPASLVMSATRMKLVDGRVNATVAVIGQPTSTYAIRFTTTHPLIPPAKVLVTIAAGSTSGCFPTSA